MPQQTAPSVLNNFSKGLKTEFTGLNFPEDAAIDTQNCVFNRIGNVNRRFGFDYETNFTQTTIDRASKAISNYKWNNAGGDGTTQVIVQQVGATLHFYGASSATIASPLSAQKLGSTITVSDFLGSGGSFDATKECQYADGNGYLFVYHPDCDPFYCTYSAGTITGVLINISIRDFAGVDDGLADNTRPVSLSGQHAYNLMNQGWFPQPSWTASSTTSNTTTVASHTWTVQTGLTISPGQNVFINGVDATGFRQIIAFGTVGSYNSGTGALAVTIISSNLPTATGVSWFFQSSNTDKRTTWQASTGNYPSNSDVWWRFKNTSGVFDVTTIPNVTYNAGRSPNGFFILNLFNQNRDAASGTTTTNTTTLKRPRTGTWFQGRVWYTGVDAPLYTECLYFSQIIERVEQFGKCYQTNDPTAEDFFDLLPTDGGVIKIQGCGQIYKLFPIQNGLLVFAANGVWFITGSQGIGFAANDYTIVKVSSIQSISSTSFVDVQGLPMWWNEEGIYTVVMGQQQEGTTYGPGRGAVGNSSIAVLPVTYASIQTFYDSIPRSSKSYVRGAFDTLDWTVKWVYKSTEASSTTTRYEFDSILVLNTVTQAFMPWNLSTTSGVPYIHGLVYVQNPGGSTAPDPAIKYICSDLVSADYKFTFAEDKSTSYVDWHGSGTDYDFTSDFTTGYRVHGQAQHRFQLQYIYMFLNNVENGAYRMQGVWDYAIGSGSNKFTSLQRTDIDEDTDDFGIAFRRHRIRGRGLVLQFKVTSVTGEPFDIIGWSVEEKINQGT